MDALLFKPRASEETSDLYQEILSLKKSRSETYSDQYSEHLCLVPTQIVDELVHQDSNVRVSALRKLQSLLASGSHSAWDSHTTPILRNLLEWFNLPATAADEVLALSLLTRLAQDDVLRKLLVDLGAVEFMKQFERDVSQSIQPFVTSFLRTLRGHGEESVSDNPTPRYVPGGEPGLWPLSNVIQVVPGKGVEDSSLMRRECKGMVLDMEGGREICKEKIYLEQLHEHCTRSGETTNSSPVGTTNCLSCPSHRLLMYQSVSSKEGVRNSAGSVEQIPWTDSFSAFPYPDGLAPILPCVHVEALDDAYLSNIDVTLRHLDNLQGIVSTFKELRESVVFDFHSEAILQKYSILQGSLKYSIETGFRVYPESEEPLQATEGNGSSTQMTSNPYIAESYPINLKSTLSGNSERAPTSSTLESGQILLTGSATQPALALGHTLHVFVIQLLPLLSNHRHRDMSLNILYELLPLLRPSEANNLPDKVQVQFTQYFHVLSEVLQTLGGKSEDLDALCVEQRRQRNFVSRARSCFPLLSVLTLSAEFLFLLRPSHVAGLLPSYLVKVLTISTGDLIFAECTFGTHPHILPYLKYLDPEFHSSYTSAKAHSAMSRTVRKRIAVSEEALAQWNTERETSSGVDAEHLLTCMVEGSPYIAVYNDKHLVRRKVQLVSDVLTIELLKAWRQRTAGISGVGHCIQTILAKARRLISLLLSHANICVRTAAYDSVLEVTNQDRWQARDTDKSLPKQDFRQEEICQVDHVMLSVNDFGCLIQWRGGSPRPLEVFQRLITASPSVLAEIITAGLHDQATHKQSEDLLLHLVEDPSEVERMKLYYGRPWIECSGVHAPDLGAFVSQISNVLVKAQLSAETGSHPHCNSSANIDCLELSSILQSLFSSCPSQRWGGSSALLKLLSKWSETKRSGPWWLQGLLTPDSHGSRVPQRSKFNPSENDLLSVRDPFEHCFLRQEGLSCSTSTSCYQEPMKRIHYTVPPVGQKKIEDLLSIFKSRSVGETIRKSAVEHLTWLIQDPSLCCLLESDEELFKLLMFEITNSITKDDVSGEESMAFIMRRQLGDEKKDKSVTPGLTGLCTACLSFMTKLASASSLDGDLKVRHMLVSNAYEQLWSLLPMVFHPSESVRKDMAVLLSFCLFSSDVLFKGLKRMLIVNEQIVPEILHQAAERVTQIRVPVPFARAYCFPCRVVAVAVKPLLANVAENSMDQGLICRFIVQSDLLEGGCENLQLLLERKFSSSGEPLELIELQALACLSVLHADISVKRFLKQLADPQLSYGVEIQFLEELEVQCSRHPQVAKALAKNSWIPSFQRFLSRFPSTADEFTELLKIMKMIQIILRSKCADSLGFMVVTRFIGEILMPILEKGPTIHYASVPVGRAAVCMDVPILRLIVDNLLYSVEHADQKLYYQVAVNLTKGTNLLSLFLTKFVKGSSSSYVCCVLAVRCFALITKGLGSFVGYKSFLSVGSTYNSQGSPNRRQMDTRVGNSQTKIGFSQPVSQGLGVQNHFVGTSLDEDLVQVIVPLIKHMAHLQSHHCRSLRHKCLVREIVSCLWSITSCVTPCLWQEVWSSTGTTYWLARLLEDQEALIRGMAFGILALLASSATSRTRELLLRNWPELGDVAVRTVLNEQECYAVREQGLCFLISATMWSSSGNLSISMEENSPPTSFKIIDGLGINAALQRYDFWYRLPKILLKRSGTPGFNRVLMELLLKLTISDVAFIKNKILEVPTFFRALVQHLEFGILQPAELVRFQVEIVSTCKHSADIYATIGYLSEVLLLLAQDEDSELQVLIQSNGILTKLFCALAYCLKNQTRTSRTVQAEEELKGSPIGADDQGEYDCAENLDRLVDLERLEAIFKLLEVLNMIINQVPCNAGPFENDDMSHIRVDDIRALNSDFDDMKDKEGCDAVVLRQNTWQNFLDLLGSQSEIFWRTGRLLQGLPVSTELQDDKWNTEEQGQVGFKPESLVRRTQLALCSFFGTVLAEDSQAKAVLERRGLKPHESVAKSGPHDHLAEYLYHIFLKLLHDVHDQIQRHKVLEGELLLYLQSLLMTVGRALQNLIKFSFKTKDFGSSLNLPSTIMRLAEQVYSLLDSYGLVPKTMHSPLPSVVRTAAEHRSKHCNKAPRGINLSNRSSFRNASRLQRDTISVCKLDPKQGKLNEHHRSLLLGELILYVRVIEVFVFRSQGAADACLEEGIFEFIWSMWDLALCEEDLMHALLGLISNLAALSNTAKEIISLQRCQGRKAGSLMDNVANMLFHLPLDQISYTLAVGVLQNLVTLAEPRAMFMRKQHFSECLQLFRSYVSSNDVIRQHLMLQLFINISAYPNGQKMFLRGLPDGSMLDLVLDSVEQCHYVPTSSSALFLLRNLAFCRETRFFFVCNERTLNLLVMSLESSSLEARAYASSALWILSSSERRISAALKNLGACPLLMTAHEASKRLLQIFHTFRAQKHRSINRAEGLDILKMGRLAQNIEQSLLAVNELVGEICDVDSKLGTTR